MGRLSALPDGETSSSAAAWTAMTHYRARYALLMAERLLFSGDGGARIAVRMVALLFNDTVSMAAVCGIHAALQVGVTRSTTWRGAQTDMAAGS